MHPPVLELLTALTTAVSAKDLEAGRALFWDDAILAGSSEEELATGEQIADFLTGAYALPFTISWDWREPLVRRHGDDVAWFYVEATLRVTGTKDAPYRATGVVERRAGEWRFSMWAGAEPA